MRFMKLSILIIFVIGIFQTSLFSEIYGVVNGYVYDKDTKKELANVTVRLMNQAEILHETKTDGHGHYSIVNVKSGTYSISFEPTYESGYCSLPIVNTTHFLHFNHSHGDYLSLVR